MDKKKIVERVSELVRPIADECGVELVDVEYVRERDWYLRVYIDKPGGIDIDDCSAVSNALEKILDEEDFIKEKYYLEVSSPGIDRPLKKDQDFIDHYGKKVDLTFYAPYDGKKMLTGELVSHDADHLVIKNFKNQKLTIERKLISSVRPHLDF
jgi:ribosome maturation factor RimP